MQSQDFQKSTSHLKCKEEYTEDHQTLGKATYKEEILNSTMLGHKKDQFCLKPNKISKAMTAEVQERMMGVLNKGR